MICRRALAAALPKSPKGPDAGWRALLSAWALPNGVLMLFQGIDRPDVMIWFGLY